MGKRKTKKEMLKEHILSVLFNLSEYDIEIKSSTLPIMWGFKKYSYNLDCYHEAVCELVEEGRILRSDCKSIKYNPNYK